MLTRTMSVADAPAAGAAAVSAAVAPLGTALFTMTLPTTAPG